MEDEGSNVASRPRLPLPAHIYRDPQLRQRLVDEDLKRIAGEGGVEEEEPLRWTRHATKRNGDECFVHKVKGDPVWWIKVVGQVAQHQKEKQCGGGGGGGGGGGDGGGGDGAGSSLVENVDNLLDGALHQRQREWHHLFVVQLSPSSPFAFTFLNWLNCMAKKLELNLTTNNSQPHPTTNQQPTNNQQPPTGRTDLGAY